MELTDDYHLKLNSPMVDREPTYVRKFADIQPTLMDPGPKLAAQEFYWGYRKLNLPKHEKTVENNHLQYDITIIPPMMLGAEFNKTVGHYHANIPGSKIAHPELYEILHGTALIMIQKMDEKFENVIAVLTMEAKAGDKIIYPPNYGHILVNIGSDVLVTANWLSTDYKPLYEPVRQKQGMAYYVVKSENSAYELVPNTKYSDVPPPRSLSKKFTSVFPIAASSQPMYASGMENPEHLHFLNKPSKYAVELSAVTS